MTKILREYVKDNMQVVEYTKDGSTVLYIETFAIQHETIPTLQEVKQQKISDLQNAYYASFVTFQSSALGELKTYPIDAEAQGNLKDLQSRLIADPNKDAFYFKAIEDGTLMLHTRVQYLQLMEDAEMFKVNQTIKINELAKQVQAATTEEEVAAINW